MNRVWRLTFARFKSSYSNDLPILTLFTKKNVRRYLQGTEYSIDSLVHVHVSECVCMVWQPLELVHGAMQHHTSVQNCHWFSWAN